MLNKEKWQEKWDRSTVYECDFEPSGGDEKNAWKALDLLSEYAAFCKKIPIIGARLPWGGDLFRSVGYGHQYSAAVEKAIQGYYLESHAYRLDEEHQNVSSVLKKIHDEVGGEINDNDPLKVILSVIKENTEIDYDALQPSGDQLRTRSSG